MVHSYITFTSPEADIQLVFHRAKDSTTRIVYRGCPADESMTGATLRLNASISFDFVFSTEQDDRSMCPKNLIFVILPIIVNLTQCVWFGLDDFKEEHVCLFFLPQRADGQLPEEALVNVYPLKFRMDASVFCRANLCGNRNILMLKS